MSCQLQQLDRFHLSRTPLCYTSTTTTETHKTSARQRAWHTQPESEFDTILDQTEVNVYVLPLLSLSVEVSFLSPEEDVDVNIRRNSLVSTQNQHAIIMDRLSYEHWLLSSFLHIDVVACVQAFNNLPVKLGFSIWPKVNFSFITEHTFSNWNYSDCGLKFWIHRRLKLTTFSRENCEFVKEKSSQQLWWFNRVGSYV